MHLSVAVLLYADDAALPADTFDDLQLSTQILVQFCNDMQLFISTEKTVLVVFHPLDDSDVVYEHDCVTVDGTQLALYIYGARIKAVSEFKYLGVTLAANGDLQPHLSSRAAASDRAAGMLLAGIGRIPGYSHSLLTYLWRCLVQPVSLYGLELFDVEQNEIDEFAKAEVQAWRLLLHSGKRAPGDVISSFMPDHFEASYRARRVSFLIRLVNSPAPTWQHLALVYHLCNNSPWLQSAIQDLRSALPGLRLHIGDCPSGPFVYCYGRWSDDRVWLSVQAYRLPRDLLGRRVRLEPARTRNDFLEVAIRNHARRITSLVKNHFVSLLSVNLAHRLQTSVAVSPFSKSLMLARRSLLSAPSTVVCLEWVASTEHRLALIAFLCGDFFLGRYAGNYFAKELLPRSSARLAQASDLCADLSRICLPCWCRRSVIILEDEAHICFSCPLYSRERTDLFGELAPVTLSTVGSLSGLDQLDAILCSQTPNDWHAFGRFLARVRRKRRKARTLLAKASLELRRVSFSKQKLDWVARGGHVCRHGVSFAVCRILPCACLSEQVPAGARFAGAMRMPAVDTRLKAIVTSPFDISSFRTLGKLQHELRCRGW